MIGTIIGLGFAFGAALNVGTRSVDAFVKNKEEIKAAVKRGIEAAKNASKEDEKKD